MYKTTVGGRKAAALVARLLPFMGERRSEVITKAISIGAALGSAEALSRASLPQELVMEVLRRTDAGESPTAVARALAMPASTAYAIKHRQNPYYQRCADLLNVP